MTCGRALCRGSRVLRSGPSIREGPFAPSKVALRHVWIPPPVSIAWASPVPMVALVERAGLLAARAAEVLHRITSRLSGGGVRPMIDDGDGGIVWNTRARSKAWMRGPRAACTCASSIASTSMGPVIVAFALPLMTTALMPRSCGFSPFRYPYS